MFMLRRLLRIGGLVVPFMLAGCASSPPRTPVPTLPPTSSSSGAIHIGPSEPGPSDEPSSTTLPDGRLRPDVDNFARDLAARRDLPLDQVLASLSGARYSATVARLIMPSVPGHKVWRSWLTYRSRFVEPRRIRWGAEFWRENAAALNQAQQRYGVPAKIIAGIIGVETLYGRNMGSFRVIDALSTLAFDYPVPDKPDRAAMFRGQLGDFLTLALQGRLDIDTRGSYAGAIGMPQFMPRSIMQYAVDSSGNTGGHIDLANDPAAAIMSVGNYLAQHGWVRGVPVFAPVRLPADPSALVVGGLAPTMSWDQLQADGARLAPGAQAGRWGQQRLGIVDLDEEARGTAQYRTGTPNFFAITQYNHSYFYATAVSDLADAVAQQVGPILAGSGL
ncbi:lytic murein transglycosylase B [Bordetella sp. FB-8]|uniref:lytic murein transglycosylase B n=1 Tax=Bordetella sp. FB-8 TaxID=1159870 RepID=UPI000475D9E9|nr:lytic murein transglycosylase B [Bordetella sp. FB-8]